MLTPEIIADWRHIAAGPTHGVNINSRLLAALLDAADERDRLAGALARAQGPFACCSHCEGDAIHDVETNAHELPCTLCQSSIGEVERLRAELDRLAAQAERVRALHVTDGEGFCRCCDYMTPHPCPTLRALDGAEEAHAHLPVTEDADGLTCDICGAELADWAAADEHVETHEGWAG